ncbi:MAG: glycosyltransferase [Chloroflexi bacterium]|nr:glycosyltransferase [Chloroflexota bacterium]
MNRDLFASVVVITRNRAPWVRICLEHLYRQDYRPFEVLVVDSSSNEETQAVLAAFPSVKSLRIPNGRNNMPQARNLGIQHAHGEIIAFLDDDSYAYCDWLTHLLKHYQDPRVGGVGGRLIDPLRPPMGNRVGYLSAFPRIELTANFVIDTEQPIEVHHLSGGTMSFRKRVLQDIGGFDPCYGGGNQGEETDMCRRVKAAGYCLIYEPNAVVDHLSVRMQSFKGNPGISHRFHEAKNWAYFWTKNFGLRFVVLKNIFLGRPLLRFRQFLTHPDIDTFHQAVVVWPGSLIGWALGLRSRTRKTRRLPLR